MILFTSIVDFIGVLILLYGFVIISENFIHSLIRHLQAQSILLGFLILAFGVYLGDYAIIALSALTFIFRGYVVPEILIKDLKRDPVWKHRELETKAKHTLVVGIILALTGLLFYRAIYTTLGTWNAAIPFVLLLLGLLIIVMRKNAIAQISGYIVEENALLYMGLILAPMSFLLEVGVLLDIIGAVLLAVILGAEKEYGPLEIDELSG